MARSLTGPLFFDEKNESSPKNDVKVSPTILATIITDGIFLKRIVCCFKIDNWLLLSDFFILFLYFIYFISLFIEELKQLIKILYNRKS